MPLKIVRDDITKLKVDAIVSPSNRELVPTGGVSYAIRQKAGEQLELACKSLEPCEPGQIKVSDGYELPCRYIFHTVGPKWQTGQQKEGDTLALCYRNALNKAQELRLKSIAFPMIATGSYGFPKDLALSVATNEISNFVLEHDLMVYLVVYDKGSYQISTQRFKEVAAYIDDHYVEENLKQSPRRQYIKEYELEEYEQYPENQCEQVSEPVLYSPKYLAPVCEPELQKAKLQTSKLQTSKSLDDLLMDLDESFSQMLLRKIKERGLTEVQCYKKANIDKKLFSKIRSNTLYKPKKTTVLAFALALELPLEELSEMLQKAGFALSHSNKADIIVLYYVQNHNYNIFEINETLFAFDQPLIGC